MLECSGLVTAASNAAIMLDSSVELVGVPVIAFAFFAGAVMIARRLLL